MVTKRRVKSLSATALTLDCAPKQLNSVVDTTSFVRDVLVNYRGNQELSGVKYRRERKRVCLSLHFRLAPTQEQMVSDFSTQYAEFSDEELLRIASDRTSLRDDVLFALNSEMQRRGLTDSDVATYEQLLKQSGQLESKERFRKIAEMFSLLLKAFRFPGLVLLNLIVAVIATNFLSFPLHRAIPLHTLNARLWKELILSPICASVIGFGMWRTWRSDLAKWTWVIPSVWFAWGLLAVAGHGIWGPLSVSSANADAARVRSFFAFTVPLIRSAAYSVGAYISSLLYPASAGEGDDY